MTNVGIVGNVRWRQRQETAAPQHGQGYLRHGVYTEEHLLD